jgi:hypothetical protein
MAHLGGRYRPRSRDSHPLPDNPDDAVPGWHSGHRTLAEVSVSILSRLDGRLQQ